MARRNRAQTQEHNRAKVLAAAREEFLERGFRAAKVDTIAARAELTRGAVYSNFPGKRALYFAVLAEAVERRADRPPRVGHTVAAALGAFARAWVTRLPLATDGPEEDARLARDLLPEVQADELTRRPFAQLLALDALLLGLALEHLRRQFVATPTRLVRMAEAVLTTLHGASQLAAAAPGFVDEFDVVTACSALAELEPDDVWAPPHVEYVPTALPTDEQWSPPPGDDAVRRLPARLVSDGVVAVLGLHRVRAVEEAVRAAPSDATVTVAMVTGEPAELAHLARLVVADLCACLREAFPSAAWPRLQVVFDQSAALATAAGVPAVSDETEAAVRIEGQRIVARAEGRGACHAAATAR